MRYICRDCEEIFYEEDAGSYQESRGEFWGAPCWESLMCCPYCKSDDIEEYQEEEEEEDNNERI